MEGNITVHYVKKFSQLVFVLGLLLLAACSQTLVPQVTTPIEDNFDKVATVELSPTDTEASLEAKYGGKVVLFSQEAGLAMLGFVEGEITALNTTTNTGAFGTPEVTALGTSAWSGGKSAWSGGKNAWSGGWKAWSGGTTNTPILPSENRAAWRNNKLPQAQALSKNFGAGVKVAVLDTGIDLNHPMFSGRLAPSAEWKDFVSNDATPQEVAGTSYGHGTAVAGIILQAAPRATILPLRVLDGEGVGDTDKIAAAIDWAIQKGAKVINLSLGTNVQATALQAWVGYAASRGVYIVASSGNSGDGNVTFPAGDAATLTYGGVNVSKYLISVGSLNYNAWSRSSFSTFGPALKVIAPGEQIFTAFPDGQTGHATGTSFAAPQVAGVLAMALSDTAAANQGNLQQYLSWSAWAVTGIGNGWGTLNAVGFMNNLPDHKVRKALLVVHTPSLLDTSDVNIKNRLEWMGYTVTLRSGWASTSSDASGHDIVLISETVNDYDVNSKFRNVAVPVMVWENYIFDDMGMTALNATDDISGQTQVSITNSTHPIAAGYAGTLAVYNSSHWMAWGSAGSNAVKIATLTSNSSRSTIFAYDAGVAMPGLTAPARRVGFFFSDFSASVMNPHAGNLFDSAVTWAVTGN
jgi:thermitase